MWRSTGMEALISRVLFYRVRRQTSHSRAVNKAIDFDARTT